MPLRLRGAGAEGGSGGGRGSGRWQGQRAAAAGEGLRAEGGREQRHFQILLAQKEGSCCTEPPQRSYLRYFNQVLDTCASALTGQPLLLPKPPPSPEDTQPCPHPPSGSLSDTNTLGSTKSCARKAQAGPGRAASSRELVASTSSFLGRPGRWQGPRGQRGDGFGAGRRQSAAQRSAVRGAWREEERASRRGRMAGAWYACF